MNSTASKDSNVFSIKDKLANGSFGSSVFKAVNPALGQIAVAKKFPPNFTSDYEGYMLMLDTVRSCRNPNIVTIHGYYKAKSQLWVVMEYCPAFSVHTLMEHFGRPLKESQIKTVLSHVLRGLIALHARQIVHTRLRCRNLLVTTYGVVKLAEPGAPVHHTDTGVNLEGIVGVSYWTAPEILLQNEWRTASDIWSLGITVIEMAERAPPYFDTHPSRVAVVVPKAPPPTYLGPESVSKYFKSFLTACLQKLPEDRVSATGLQVHKFVKKADPKGMYTMAQKYLKTRNNRYSQPEATLPQKLSDPVPKEDDDVDVTWAESDTLRWEPIGEYVAPNRSDLRKSSSLSVPSPSSSSSRSPVRRAPSSPAALRSATNQSTGTMKRAPQPALQEAEEGPSQTVSGRRESQGEAIQQRRGSQGEVNQGRRESQGEVVPRRRDSQVDGIPRVSARYQDSTVTINPVQDYTPQYMSHYSQGDPGTLSSATRPELSPPEHGSLLRRNSIDQRGMEAAKVKEELRAELGRIDHEYCRGLMEARTRYLAERERLGGALGGGVPPRDIWSLLEKGELVGMLRFLESRHQEELRGARDLHEMERVILTQSLKTTPDRDREVEIRETLLQKEKEHSASVTSLKREFTETQASVLRALEKIQCVDDIASE